MVDLFCLELSGIERRAVAFFIREYLRQPGATARYVEDVIEATR